MDRNLNLSPADDHNRELVAHVHPPGWTNPEPASRYNLVVIGAGSAGLVTAAGAAGMGAKVALVEKHLMGGDCLNVGCVPSKAVVRSGHAVADIRRAADLGIHITGETEVDFAAVMRRMRRIRSDIAQHDSARRFSEVYGVDVFFGAARFSSRSSVIVGDHTLRFAKAVIATGARAAVPPIPGLAEAGFLTNDTVFNLTELPRRIAVLGGGPIGCELAQAFVRLGSRVTIVEMMESFLPREDPDAAHILRDALEQDGIDLRLSTRLDRVEASPTVRVLHLSSGGSTSTLTVDQILVAVGRVPNTDGLGLEAAGVTFDRHGVTVDDHLRTTNRRVYASGDVCMSHKFTHLADATSRAVVQNALFPGPKKKISRLVIPWCTYTDPEVAHVGLSATAAAERGMAVDTYTVPMSEVDRALTDGDDVGLLKVHTQHGGDKILGATLVARHAGEMISEITLAMVNGVGLGSIAGVMHPYPTQAEVIRKAADAFNRTKLTPRTTALLRRWFAFTR